MVMAEPNEGVVPDPDKISELRNELARLLSLAKVPSNLAQGADVPISASYQLLSHYVRKVTMHSSGLGRFVHVELPGRVSGRK